MALQLPSGMLWQVHWEKTTMVPNCQFTFQVRCHTCQLNINLIWNALTCSAWPFLQYLLFVTSNMTCMLSFTAQRPNVKVSGTAMSALGRTARMGTEKEPSCGDTQVTQQSQHWSAYGAMLHHSNKHKFLNPILWSLTFYATHKSVDCMQPLSFPPVIERLERDTWPHTRLEWAR